MKMKVFTVMTSHKERKEEETLLAAETKEKAEASAKIIQDLQVREQMASLIIPYGADYSRAV